MKLFRFKLLYLACLTVLISISACQKDDYFVENASNVSEANPQATGERASYGVTPTVGNYTTNSTTTVTLSNLCGTFNGGTIRAKVQAQNGSQFTVRISRQDGAGFSTSGTAYVKSGHVCGGIAGSASYNVGATYVDVTFTAYFSLGVVHFYPVVVSSNGSKHFAEPLMVYTSPTYNTGPYSNGTVIGRVNDVVVYASGPSNISLTSAYQCVEFTKRYYAQIYNMNVWLGAGQNNAVNWYGTASQRGLSAFANGGSTAPRVGDILCFSGNTYGHVAIITEVQGNLIKVAQQNSGSAAPIGCTFTRSGNTISASALGSGYTVQGWLRKP